MTDYKQELIDALALSHRELDKAAKTFTAIQKLACDDNINSIADSASVSCDIVADNFYIQRKKIEEGLDDYVNQKQSQPNNTQSLTNLEPSKDVEMMLLQIKGIATILSCDDQFDSVNRDDVAASIHAICELARSAVVAYREEDTATPVKKGVA